MIDTGGYVPNSAELFETAIREQVEIALDEADAILFVTDGRDGMTPMMKKLEECSIHQATCNCLVNKLDNATMV